VARHLNVPLIVELREMTDAQAIAAMHSENFNRKDVSPYERGLSYARFLRSGIFKSQEELAKSIGVSPAQVCRLVRLSKLPTVIVDAFRSPVEICETWGLDLIEAWENPNLRPQLTRRARSIAAQSPRLPARCAYRALMMAVTPGRQPVKSNRDEVIKSSAGAPLFRIRRNARAVVLMLPAQSASPANVALIRSSVAAILEKSNDPPRLAHRHRASLALTSRLRDERAVREAYEEA
jgi:ParB-like chromosome segregation protein Spo0J